MKKSNFMPGAVYALMLAKAALKKTLWRKRIQDFPAKA
jgi:hypothetical protein